MKILLKLILVTVFLFDTVAYPIVEQCLAPKSTLSNTLYSEISSYFASLPNASYLGRESYAKVTEDPGFKKYEKAQQRFFVPANMTLVVPVIGIVGIAAFHIMDSLMHKDTQISDQEKAEYKAKAETTLKDIFELAKSNNDVVLLRALTYVKNIEITTDMALVGSHGKDIGSGTLYLHPRMIDDHSDRYLIFRRAMGLKFSNEVMLRQGTSNSISESFWSRYIAYHWDLRKNLKWNFGSRMSAIPNGFIASFSRGKDRRILTGDYKFGAWIDPLNAISNQLISAANSGKNIRSITYEEFFPWKPDPTDGRYYDEDRIAVEFFESIRSALVALMDSTGKQNDQEAMAAILAKANALKVQPYLLVADHLGLLPSYNVTINHSPSSYSA